MLFYYSRRQPGSYNVMKENKTIEENVGKRMEKAGKGTQNCGGTKA